MEYKLLDLRVHELKDDNSLVHYAHWEKVIVWSDTKKNLFQEMLGQKVKRLLRSHRLPHLMELHRLPPSLGVPQAPPFRELHRMSQSGVNRQTQRSSVLPKLLQDPL